MKIILRPIQYASPKDRENYAALQKSVAILPNMQDERNAAEVEERLWNDMVADKNRVCYVIETAAEHEYCGECAIKDISCDLPEIEIELLQEFQHQGIGYQAVIELMKRIERDYQKNILYARVEPDHYVSQLLCEKLGGELVGLSRDYKISDDRKERFVESHRALLNDTLRGIAQSLNVAPEKLLTYVLVYRFQVGAWNDVKVRPLRDEQPDMSRKITKAKMTDTMYQYLEELEELQKLMEEGCSHEKMQQKLNEMEENTLKSLEQINGGIQLERI